MADRCVGRLGTDRRDVAAATRPVLSRRMRAWAAISLMVGAALGLTLWRPPRPILLWNASASSPIGLYIVRPREAVRAGDTVVAWAPPWAARLAAARGYLPAGVPLVKRVSAVAGDRVCARNGRIFVNGREAGARLARDASGRTMPRWSGCRVLGTAELFLLNPRLPEAFDGRYFGVIPGSAAVGKARLLWTR